MSKPSELQSDLGIAAGPPGVMGQAECLDAMGEVSVEPMRDTRRQRGDDDLVEPAALEHLLRRDEGIVVADQSLDVLTRGLVEQRQSELERGRGLLRLLGPLNCRTGTPWTYARQ